MDEEKVKNILLELKKRRVSAENKIIDRISDAELKHSYNGKWGLYILFKNGFSMITPFEAATYNKSYVLAAIERFDKGMHNIKFSCGTKVTRKDLVLIILLTVKG